MSASTFDDQARVGYVGQSMSVRAAAAYDDDARPLSKITAKWLRNNGINCTPAELRDLVSALAAGGAGDDSVPLYAYGDVVDHVAEGFTAADLDQILRMPGEPASVARATHGYHRLPRRVIILGRAEVVRPGRAVLAVDEEAVWTRDCRVGEITDIAMIDGVPLVRATGVIG